VKRTIRNLILLVASIVLPMNAAAAEAAAKPAKPPKGHGRYVMVLWEPGTPIPGDDSKQHKKHVPEPDVVKLGGKLLHSKQNQRVIDLPVAAAKELRRHESVVYLQRLWMGEPLEELEEEPDTSGSRSRIQSDSDTNLTWGPKEYTYDGSGNIKKIGKATDSFDNYTYDTAGRLISSTVGSKTETYKYDAFGNLTEKAVTGSNPVTIPVDPSSNRMVGATYDAAGNVTSRQGTEGTYTYDSFNMLTSVRSRTMIYDANDERIGVIIDSGLSRWTLRDFQGRAIREYKGEPINGEAYWVWEQDYVYGESELIGGERLQWTMEDQNGVETEYGGIRHYHLDHLGSVRLVTNGAKRAVSEHDYYPYGVTSTKTYQEQINWGDPHVDAMRYAGHQRDFLGYLNAENNDYLDYMHARYYDPNLGRFLSVDPGPSDLRRPMAWNRYAYAGNNPINNNDPDGRLTNPVTREQGKGQPIVHRGGSFGQIRKEQPNVKGSAGGEFGAARSGGRTHKGIDIVAPVGTPLVAAFGGTAYQIRPDDPKLGLSVFVRGKDGIIAIYSHLKSTDIKEGETVKEGQQMGEAGRTGNVMKAQPASEDHVHFQLYGRDGKVTDPEAFLNDADNQQRYRDREDKNEKEQ
jgi:RHS repeat-associated protein